MAVKELLKNFFNLFRKKRIVYVHDVARPYEIQLVENGRFKNQLAVITGGSGVIGRSICYRLAAEGAKVIVCGTNQERLMKTVNEIRHNGLLAEPCIFNLNNSESIIAAFKDIEEKYGIPDLFVSCAGGGARNEMRSFIDQKIEVIDDVLSSNLRGGMLCTQQSLKLMSKRGKGDVIIISSTVGIGGMPNYSEYAAAKAGLNAFMKSIAMEYGYRGIRCNCVSPGIVQRGTIDDLQMESIAKTNWLNTYGKPEDIANMVAFLHSEEASFITGQNFVVDGGRSLGLKGQK